MKAKLQQPLTAEDQTVRAGWGEYTSLPAAAHSPGSAPWSWVITRTPQMMFSGPWAQRLPMKE